MQFPGLDLFLLAVTGISVFGAAADRLFSNPAMAPSREALSRIWLSLTSRGGRGLTAQLQEVITHAFDVLYGERTFGGRRVRASLISTTLAYVLVTALVGYEDSLVEAFVDLFAELYGDLRDPANELIRDSLPPILLFAAAPILFNYVPDFVSLWETRKVLGWARNAGPSRMLLQKMECPTGQSCNCSEIWLPTCAWAAPQRPDSRRNNVMG